MYNTEDIKVVKIALAQAIDFNRLDEEQADEIIFTLREKLKDKVQSGILNEYSDLMTVKEVCQSIKRCDRTVNRMLKDGRLRGVKKKKGNLIFKKSVIAWLLED